MLFLFYWSLGLEVATALMHLRTHSPLHKLRTSKENSLCHANSDSFSQIFIILNRAIKRDKINVHLILVDNLRWIWNHLLLVWHMTVPEWVHSGDLEAAVIDRLRALRSYTPSREVSRVALTSSVPASSGRWNRNGDWGLRRRNDSRHPTMDRSGDMGSS